jgi:AcrR family transcriptional regulator
MSSAKEASGMAKRSMQAEARAKDSAAGARGRSPRGGDAPARKLARDKVFAVAADLFYRRGVRAVGVETIVKEAGVAKISLYRSFPSKDDLVVAYLEERGAAFWRQWDADFARHDGDPRAQLQAIMRYLAERTTRPGYQGCPFINYCAEFREPEHAGRRAAAAVKSEMRRRFRVIAERLGAALPDRLADSLLLLVEGAYAISQTLGGGAKGAGHALPWAALALVEAELGQAAPPATRTKAATRTPG